MKLAILIRSLGVVVVLQLVTHALAWPDADEEDIPRVRDVWDGLRHVVTFRDTGDRAAAPSDDVLKQVRVEWRGADVDTTWRLLLVRGRLVVGEGERVRPVDWFEGVRVLLARSDSLETDWIDGHSEDDTAVSDLLVSEDGTFTAVFPLSEVPRKGGAIRERRAAVVLPKRAGRRLTFHPSMAPLPASLTSLKLPAGPVLGPTLQLINAASPWPSRCADPTALVKAVNGLQALGKQEALDALRRYVEIAPRETFHDETAHFDAANIDQGDSNVAFCIIPLLFEPAQAGMHLPSSGFRVHSPPKEDVGLWPLYPIELVDDIPFYVGVPLILSTGRSALPSSHIEWAERYGVLRDAPLHPADDPLAVADRFLSLPKVERLKLRSEPIWTQSWQFVADLFPTIKPDAQRFDELAPEQWNDLRKAAAEKKIHWDEKQQAYVLGEWHR